MKLISKEFTIDVDSYAPVVRITVEVALEFMSDNVALMGDDGVKMLLGTELLEILKNERTN